MALSYDCRASVPNGACLLPIGLITKHVLPAPSPASSSAVMRRPASLRLLTTHRGGQGGVRVSCRLPGWGPPRHEDVEPGPHARLEERRRPRAEAAQLDQAL